MTKSRPTTLLTILFLTYILLLAGVILFKLPFFTDLSDRVRTLNLIPFLGSYDEYGVLGIREIFLNLLFFIPFGIYIGILRSAWSFPKKLLPILGCTLAFEIIQFVFIIGVADITDVLSNTLGGITGLGVCAILRKILKTKTAVFIAAVALPLTIIVALRFFYLFYLSHFVMGRPG